MKNKKIADALKKGAKHVPTGDSKRANSCPATK